MVGVACERMRKQSLPTSLVEA